MTQAFSRLLARQRPLLALAVVAALFAAAVAALAPAGAQTTPDPQGSQQTITWSIGLALKDVTVPPDGIFEKGDAPELQVVFSAAITPDASDQANADGISKAMIEGSSLMFADATSLTISGGQGIEFQLGPNSQIDRLRGSSINTQGTTTAPFSCTTPGSGASSSGSSPATATCTIDTGIMVSIPQTVADATYTIRGRVEFSAGSLVVDYEQADGDGTRSMASAAFTGSTDVAARTFSSTNPAELNNASASTSLPIGPVAAVASVTLDPANKCADPADMIETGLDDGVLATTGSGDNELFGNGAGEGTTACKTTLRTSGGNHSHFELKIRNSANRGVVPGQVVAVVGTIVRKTGGSATFAACGGERASSASCTPTLGAGQTGSSFFTVKAPSTPGTATLRIQVVPRAGGTETRERELIFTGTATSIELSDVPSTILNRNTDADDAQLDDLAKGTDSIVLAVTPKDADGNVVAQTRAYSFELTGPDARRVSYGTVATPGTNKIIVDRGPTPSTSGTAHEADPNQVLIDVTAPATAPLMTGEYTLKVSRTARNLSATTTFRVVGPAGNLALSLGDECTNGRASLAEVGCTFDITATITDADGNNVADGTDVALSATNTDGTNAQNLILSGSGSDSTRTTLRTAGGSATGTATVVGNGEVLIVATASGGTVSDSQIADTTAAASGAGAESNVLACLSKVEVGEYSTYICDATLTADALFSVLRNRGADAIYLRSVGSWVRYATNAAGAPLPGSADNFTAVKYDTLFIGG